TVTDGKRTPLPREGEVLVLQASAGTGKTWQVADMVLRAVVADASLTVDRFLLVTYTNAAVAELRDRVRGRLEDARRVLAGDDPPPGDATLAELAAGRDASPEPRRRVETALARFDELLVSTIHGFCQRMLDAHATRAGLVPPREIVASADEVVARACAELRGAVARWSDPDRYEALVELLDWNGTANLGGAAWKTARAALVGPSPPKFEVIAPEDSDTRVLSPFDAVDAAVTACRLHAARLVAVKDRLQSVLERPKGSLCSPRRKNETTEAVVGALRILLDCATKLHQYASADGPIDETILRTSVDLYRAHDENREARRQHWQVDQDEDVGALATLYDAFDRDISLVRQRLVRTLVEPLRRRVRAELERTGVLTYDEMLARLDDALEEPHGGALGDAIRAQFHFAIVDEFQDTDPAQWSILRKLFAHAQTRLVLVGDPKQSIYGFRGADIHTYESAIQDAIAGVTRTVHELSTNHRSDPLLLEALEHLFGPGGGTFMTDAFDFVHVEARPGRIPFGMRNAPEVPAGETTRPRRPLEIRHGEATADACAEEIAALLAAGTEIADDDGHWRGLSPGDVAVLVYTHEQARRIHCALAARGIPSVRAATESVFESDAATWLLRLVRACAGGRRELHLFLDTPLGGFEPEDLSIFTGEADPADERAAAAYRRLDEAANAVAGMRAEWERHGFGRAIERFLEGTGALERLATMEDGDRHVTDLRHLVELCHAEQRRGYLGPEQLARFLERAVREGSGRDADDARLLRLETDDDAVQIVTVWKSKGLSYEVVFVPFAGERTVDTPRMPPVPLVAYDPEKRRRVLTVAGAAGGEYCERLAQQDVDDEFREQIRLIYVALTRARHHVVLHVPHAFTKKPKRNGAKTISTRRPLLHLLGRPRDEEGRPTTTAATFGDPEDLPGDEATLRERLAHLAETSGGTIGVAGAEASWPRTTPATSRKGAPAPVRKMLDPVRFPWDFQVASFTAWASGRTVDVEEPLAESERALDEALRGMETMADEAEPVTDEAKDASAPSPETDLPVCFDGVPAGRKTGTAIHALFERLDFESGALDDGTAPDTFLAAEFRAAGVDPDTAKIVADDLPKILETPLDSGRLPLPAGFSLRRLARADRLDEFAFDLSLGAGSAYRRRGPDALRLDKEAVGDALRLRRDLDPKWEGRPWLDKLVETSLPAVAGILTGSIDLLFRVGDGDRTRFYVADYKTNRLSFGTGQGRGPGYGAEHLAHVMASHGYHLQGLLYTVAAHRFLRDRLGSAYDYERNFGGHLYLFLRGMTGPDAPRTGPAGAARGVYADRWPQEVIEPLDAALGMGLASTRERSQG
ncbi:MAG: hypothetical protein D6705_10510, partial [Deltaproteobacteria bacterium]